MEIPFPLSTFKAAQKSHYIQKISMIYRRMKERDGKLIYY